MKIIETEAVLIHILTMQPRVSYKHLRELEEKIEMFNVDQYNNVFCCWIAKGPIEEIRCDLSVPAIDQALFHHSNFLEKEITPEGSFIKRANPDYFLNTETVHKHLDNRFFSKGDNNLIKQILVSGTSDMELNNYLNNVQEVNTYLNGVK